MKFVLEVSGQKHVAVTSSFLEALVSERVLRARNYREPSASSLELCLRLLDEVRELLKLNAYVHRDNNCGVK